MAHKRHTRVLSPSSIPGADARRESITASVAERHVVSGTSNVASSASVMQEAPPPDALATATPHLLSNTASINNDEEYSRDEQMLNEFTKLHPMLRYATALALMLGRLLRTRSSVRNDTTSRVVPCVRSMETTTSRTMQIVADMIEKTHVCIPHLEEVGKSHDDQFLTEANAEIGERSCVCGSRCLANFIAMVRYGHENDKGFVCKEFLLPSQFKKFLDGNGLPPIQQKCIVCTRYWMVRALAYCLFVFVPVFPDQ